jgi:hypothetical protein
LKKRNNNNNNNNNNNKKIKFNKDNDNNFFNNNIIQFSEKISENNNNNHEFNCYLKILKEFLLGKNLNNNQFIDDYNFKINYCNSTIVIYNSIPNSNANFIKIDENSLNKQFLFKIINKIKLQIPSETIINNFNNK